MSDQPITRPEEPDSPVENPVIPPNNALDSSAERSVNGSMNTATMPPSVANPATPIADPFAAMTAGLVPKRAVSYIRVSTKEQAERGGQEEGFSIPAQRDANKRKAQSMGAMVVKEFVERGVSGTTTNRPALQEMLRYLEEEAGSIDYVIVHKIDRLARNRADDVEINRHFEEYDVRLVSTSENIDQTPGGLLLHGIMSSIAEFYSRNLSNEVKKGMAEKVRQGGTHGKAPLGYKNVREIKDGRENRTVEVDNERAPLITWAFEQYATGEHTLRSLCQELVRRGLTMPQTARLPEKPVETRQIHQILTNDYYLGIVNFNGTKYPGNHEPLITSDLFDRVQQVLRSKVNGERSIKHDHYLKSTLWCGQCGYRMMVQVAKTRSDLPYPYYSCTGRHSKRTNCDIRSITFDRAEELIQELYDRLAMKPAEADKLEKLLKQSLRDLTKDTTDKRESLASQKLQIERRQRKLLEAHYNDAIPMDMLRREQKELDSQLLSITRDLDTLSTDLTKTDGLIEMAMELSVQSAQAYKQAPDHIRRMFNRLFFKELRVVMDKEDNHQLEAILAPPFDELYSPNWRRLPTGVASTTAEIPVKSDGDSLLLSSCSHVDVSSKSSEVIEMSLLETEPTRGSLETSGQTPYSLADVSSKSTVVPPVGLEPTLC